MAIDDLEHGILVVDFGSQTTLLIARRFRELGVYSEVWACDDDRLVNPPACLGVVLSGGPASVSVPASPRVADALMHLDRPILGICYGMQLMVEQHGGVVQPSDLREYGHTEVEILEPDGRHSRLLEDMTHRSTVWMSHGDAVTNLPDDFEIYARTADGVVAAIENRDATRFGVQFHPEVTHTKEGIPLLRRFAHDICGGSGDWAVKDLAGQMIEEIRATVGDKRVICGLSGGVDSTVTAALIAEAIHDRLTCILVDTGLMREGEVEEVSRMFREHFDAELRVIDARALFVERLAGTADPEEKRKIIGHTFIDVFEEATQDIDDVGFLAQGTLYPDVIESVSVRGPSATIKSHHNVGGLPERLPFALLEPLRFFFKDEVRAIGRSLGIPEWLIGRHPFPGPGLAIRVIGEVTETRLETVRKADKIFIDMLRGAGLYDEVWQAFCVLLPVKTVGVMGDARTYESVLALRSVNSLDGMTAERSPLPLDFLTAVANQVIRSVPGINRVVYDVTSKPPGTIEWE